MAVKTRWDQKTYRRHMFNRGRGVRSPYDTSNTKMGTSQFVDSQLEHGSWWEASWRSPWATKLDAAKEYEQYNNPDSAGWSPFTFDSTERERFRTQDRKEVRDLFQEQLSKHHFSKYKKLSSGQLDKIVDAYMSQDDDKFQATLAGMGFSGKDAGRVRRAAEESAAAAIENTKYGTKWDDDDYAKQSGAKPGAVATGNQPGQAGQGGTVANGQPKVPQPGAAQGQAPVLTPRNAGPTPQTTAGSIRRFGRVAGQSTNQIDGANVRTGNQPAMAHMDQDAANKSRIAALRSGDQAQLQTAVSSLTPSEAYQVRENERERIEQMGKDRRARQAAEREAAAQRRADKRFASRTLYNEADWRNLGREGSNKADYSKDRLAGETDDQFNARQKLVTERQGRMDALLKRLDAMGEKDVEKNSFYANDPNKQQNLARLRGLIVGDDGKVRGDITDAQIEGANATLDAWQKSADERGARNKSFSDMKQAEHVARLRDQYGPAFGDYSAEQLLDYDKRQRESARAEILKGMQVAPGLTPDQVGQPEYQGRPEQDVKDLKPAAMAKFSQDWQKLLDTGFDPTTTFKEKILGNQSKREAYEAGLATLSRDDPDYADKADQLRRRFIVQQAMEDAGIGGEGGAETGAAGRQLLSKEQRLMGIDAPPEEVGQAMAQNLPGKSVLVPREVAEAGDTLKPKTQSTPGVQVFAGMKDARNALNEANVAAGLRPRQSPRLRPGDKLEEI